MTDPPLSLPPTTKTPPPGRPSRNSISNPSQSHNSPPHLSGSLPHYRNSLAENLRGVPSSPRANRHGSISSSSGTLAPSGIPALDIINNPPNANERMGDGRFTGRDWKSVKVGEVVDRESGRFVESGCSVEEATNLLISSGSPNVILISDSPTSRSPIGTFDYSDLNAYLLLVVGLAQPDSEHVQSFRALAQKGREGKPIPLADVKNLGNKESLITLEEDASLAKAVEIFGSGAHRILVTKGEGPEVVGVLTQLRMVQFFWDHGRHFAEVEGLFTMSLKELGVGSRDVVTINGDRPLTDALELMDRESITSLPVLDNARNVVGNISHVDVRLLTSNTALPLLRSSCIHFISVILNERGVTDGKDSFPVFHVQPMNTLAHTVAKLVATRSHRMWITESQSPSSSGPPTPLLAPSQGIPPPAALHQQSPQTSNPSSIHSSPLTNTHAFPQLPASSLANPPHTTVSAAALPGANLSGHLSGVVSLTDILNLFARASGLRPGEPGAGRLQRRRGSSVSMGTGGDLGRSGSISGR